MAQDQRVVGSARRSVYSTSGVSETWIEATAILSNLLHNICRHCEERSDEAIQTCFAAPWIASLRSQ
jgi:hypothetical protein